MPASAASRAFRRACSHGHSGRAGKMRGDEYATFPPLPGDRHPPADHPLPALRPHPRLPPGNISEVLTEHYRRAHPEALGTPPNKTEPAPNAAGDPTADVRKPSAHLRRATGASNHGACSLLWVANARRAAVRLATFRPPGGHRCRAEQEDLRVPLPRRHGLSARSHADVSALWPSLGGGLVSGGPAGRGRGLGRHDALASRRRAAESDRRYELSLGATPTGRPGRMTGFPGRGRSRERSEGC
jgi:hypothetical protein